MIKQLSERYPLWLAASGLLLILSAFFWYGDIRQTVATYAFSPGAVVDFEQSAFAEAVSTRPVIHFLSHKGEMVELILADNQRGLLEGDTVDVMYPSSDPFSGDVYSQYVLWGGPALILFFGMIILLIFFVLITKDKFVEPDRTDTFAEAIEEDDLDDEQPAGIALNTLFVSVEKNRGAAVNGQMPYCIFTQWRDPITSEIHFFKSGDLWLDPTQYIKRKKVKVFIEEHNLKQYNVDLSFLPDDVVTENSRLNEQYMNKSA